MKAIIALVLSFVFGAVLGHAAGFDAQASGFVVTSTGIVANVFGLMPKGVLSMTLDLTAFNAEMNSYLKTSLPQIWSKVRQGMELDQYVGNMVPNVYGTHKSVASITTDILQAFQTQWTPKGGTSFTALSNESFHLKADFPIENIHALFGTYLEFLAADQTALKDWPFPKWLMENELIPKMIEEINTASCNGSYVAPTAGTAGSVTQMMDGILTKVADLITATSVTPIVTGAITSSNALAKVETYVKAIDPKYRQAGKKNIILTSNYVVECYKENYRTLYGLRDKDASNNAKLDMFPVELVGINGFGTSQRMIMTPSQNLLKLYGKIGAPDSLKTQEDKRVLNLLGDWWIGYGFATAELLFVNDQA